jgi:glyoxylase-like metal-dependent hydrolase (beta-lactamase superfamily II)
MKHLIFLLSATSLLLYTQGLNAQGSPNEPITLEKIAENIYQLKGGRGSNGGVIVGDDAVLVIDAKMNEASVLQTMEAIEELTDKPLRYLVNTHSDGDHIQGNRYFPASVMIIAHENCRDDFFKRNFGRASDWDEPQFYPFVPSITFSEQLDIWMGKSKVELHYFGVGHTSGDAVVYCPAAKIAFVADLYFAERPQLIHSAKGGNSFEYVKSMKKMLETLDAETFLSGHSEPAGRADLKKHLQEMEARQEKVKVLLKDGMTQEKVLAAFDPSEKRLITSVYQELTAATE